MTRIENRSMKRSYSIVLVRPTGELNIGSAARAMLNFGLTDLRLVQPVDYLNDNAFQMACNAIDILESAQTFSSLPEALADTHLSIGFTRRPGGERKTLTNFRESLELTNDSERVAFVFGCERDGLSNDDVQSCNACAYIPTSDLYPSINLAQAVGIVCYELFNRDPKQAPGDAPEWIERRELDALLGRFDSALQSLEYNETREEEKLRRDILAHMERLLTRGRIKEKECHMLHGFFARILEFQGKE